MTKKKKIRPLSEKKRNSILRQASKLFMKKGFGAVSMDEISKAADVSKRTLYNHFPAKKILFREIVKIQWQKVKNPKIHDSYIREPEEIVTVIIKHMMKIMYSVRMQKLVRLVIAESSKFPELKLLHAKYGAKPLLNEFAAYIKSLSKKGVLHVDNPGIAAAQYIGLIKECLYWPWLLGIIAKPSERHQNDIIKRANKIFFSYYKV